MVLVSDPQAVSLVESVYEVEAGCPHPCGATPDSEGVNFSLFSEGAISVELLLFENPNDEQPTQVIALDPSIHKTFHLWHARVKGLKPGSGYAYRVEGPQDLHGQGHRFNRNKVLIDPFAKANDNSRWERVSAIGNDDNLARSMRSVVVDISNYSWEGDTPLARPMNETVIYEMHVKGFTRSATDVKSKGTFRGIIEKIPYLKELGITAVELLPIFDFDETENLREVNGVALKDYWGYNPHSYFAIESSYCANPRLEHQLNEFRDMVKALHKAGIEVILDVVFNHTSEGNHEGPTINFKGLDNRIYYHLVSFDQQYYMDYSGCGSTVNCNHPMVEKLILECLEFWVSEMHVDGFRFDEASILSRGQDGTPMSHPPIIWHIETSQVLADTKIIAEAWDAAGLYQIGYFPGYRWAEWNGRFRDDVRKFVKGDPGMVGAVAFRIAGSADLYQSRSHLPINSVNFITCHDGFTLNDLVSYNDKHNESNGEDNRDGITENLSWNCGREGDTDDLYVEALRRKQIKNFAVLLLISQGVPMIVAGDEVRRTQQGNNNAYCQDSEISWFDWSLVDRNADMLRFFKHMIAFRKCYCHASLMRRTYFTGKVNERGLSDLSWHGLALYQPGWDDPNARALAFTLGGTESAEDIHVMMNMYWQDLDFELPAVEGRRWFKAVDTNEASPLDIVSPGQETAVSNDASFTVKERSIVILVSR
ncbi:glycogen debranching protein GlgX [cf. Phormidesmis sp. LEGE 11477]|uniref:glycogen debranching protein GlgX n=1 Tax=cf. Phormidesmis sp. LEGE 11477 TaxID=1828680 RepID=UPI001881F737|nr:glycogen debranching protein GlgX [cf. Phormidesmis sp. LEGE 11477]MBE9062271.1 glycogen debranching protein GlgX [cf. Phormidesmis sp. LEGE 11477]